MSSLLSLLGFALGEAPAVPAHPLHTTLATVEWHGDRRQLEVAVRVFTQDLAEAVTQSRAAAAPGAVPDSTACRYATGVLSIQNVAGKRFAPATCATERAADITWIRLTVPVESPTGLSVRNAFLFEHFPDQINIVQANLAGRTRTILFTSGDGPKPLT